MRLSDAHRDVAARIALATVILIGFGMASAHMLTDGDCEFAPLGPMPENGAACGRAGGTWNPSHGFWHVAYEFGHVAFWPLIILIAIVCALLVVRPRMPNSRVTGLSQ